MKAVNLVPLEQRSVRGGPARTGSAPYVLLGGLAVAVVLVAVWALAGREIADREAALARTTQEADAAEARAGSLQAYTDFAELRRKRVETVGEISRTRFNWPYAIRALSRSLPEDVWLLQVVGTVAPGVLVEGATGGATSALRGQVATPAVEIVGCATDQTAVARYMAQIRLVPGVTRVALAASEKNELSTEDAVTSTGGGNTAGADSSDCRTTDEVPRFELVAFFETSPATTSSDPAAPASSAGAGAEAPTA